MTIVADQAQALRELAARSEREETLDSLLDRREQSDRSKRPDPMPPLRAAQVLAVTSGKGGVGKSNMSVNLAIRLASLGRKVMVLDADLGTANADVLCGIEPVGTLAHVVAGRRRLEDIVLDAPGGFRLVPGVSGLAAMASLEEAERARLISQMRSLESQVDLILIDTGAGINPNVLSFTGGADEVLVVTTAEPTAITDAYALMKAAHRQRPDVPLRLLVNMVRDREQGLRVFERMDRVCRQFLGVNLRFAGHVVRDECVAAGVRRRRPFMIDSPRCGAARCLEAVAQRIDRGAAPDRSQGWVSRMMGWMRTERDVIPN